MLKNLILFTELTCKVQAIQKNIEMGNFVAQEVSKEEYRQFMFNLKGRFDNGSKNFVNFNHNPTSK